MCPQLQKCLPGGERHEEPVDWHENPTPAHRPFFPYRHPVAAKRNEDRIAAENIDDIAAEQPESQPAMRRRAVVQHQPGQIGDEADNDGMAERGQQHSAHQDLKDDESRPAHFFGQLARLAHQHQPCLQPTLECSVQGDAAQCDNIHDV